MKFTKQIHSALDFAAFHHKEQSRKDPDRVIPMISHLYGVSLILASHGFDEEVITAGVLHDFLEDIVQEHNRPELAKEMKKVFGKRVYDLVGFVTQKKKDKKGNDRPWTVRNMEYNNLICDPKTPNEARAISCADKIHNIQSLLLSLERNKRSPKAVWGKFNAAPDEIVHKYWMMIEGMDKVWQHPILDDLIVQVDELTRIVEKS